MAVSPGVVVGAPESAPIALMEVSSRSVVEEGNPGRLVFSSGGSREPTAANPVDTTFTNGAGNSTDTGTPHPVSPWNGTRPREHSRSPSLGDTFVSAAASSDLPYPSSSSPSDSSDDSAAEEAEMLDVSVTRSAFGYITTATITLSGSHSSLDAKDVIGSGPNQPQGRSFADNGNSTVIPTVSSDTEQAGTFLSPGHAPSSSSESTSISMSIGMV
ncbi:hypothetical protein ZHAS_00006004 [Anopheles sinensis]|uniref:Uncharacterized protein n=1 Tax=Anopheles sinensis TaxID=74873 RepID=A0A084VKY0_ANOSI|nr:hypothetical protein ZHAS_00006004 [Anopheles sinensis]